MFENYEDAKKYLINFLKDKIENTKISIKEAERRLIWKIDELREMETLFEKMKNGSWDY